MTLTRPATAEPQGPPWLRIEHVEASPSVFEGYARLRLYVTAINLQGVFLDDITGDKAWTLKLNKQKKRLPFIAGNFEGTDDELALAVIIATTPGFADTLPAIKKHVDAFLEKLPKKRTQAVIIGYDDEVHGSRRLRSLARAQKDLEKLETGDIPGQEALLKAVDQARRTLAKAKPETPGTPLRRIIVVISDGRDIEYPRAESYRKVAKQAGRDEIPIHSIAFAPDNNRLPLRGLGELSKRSQGTFRFAYTKNGITNNLDQLTKEILDQYVLTFFVPNEDVVGKRIGLIANSKDMESDEVRVPKLTCGENTCAEGEFCSVATCTARSRAKSRGILGWLLLAGGVLAGLVVLVVAVGLIASSVQRRRENAAMLASAASQAAQAQPGADQQDPAQTTGSHRIIAQGPQGQAVAPTPGRAPSQHGMPPSSRHAALPPSGAYNMPPSSQHQVLPAGASGVHRAPSAQGQPSLLVIKGPYQGQRIPLHHGFFIGKAPGCHLQLTGDTYASGHHAQIVMDTQGGCTLIDQNSTNGTFVNGVRTREKRLAHGMLITIGSTEARFLAQ